MNLIGSDPLAGGAALITWALAEHYAAAKGRISYCSTSHKSFVTQAAGAWVRPHEGS